MAENVPSSAPVVKRACVVGGAWPACAWWQLDTERYWRDVLAPQLRAQEAERARHG